MRMTSTRMRVGLHAVVRCGLDDNDLLSANPLARAVTEPASSTRGGTRLRHMRGLSG